MGEKKNETLNWIPVKYRERVARFEADIDLIDGCKYMLYLNKENGWVLDEDDLWYYPVKSKKEALELIKDAIQIPEEERKDL